MTIQLSKLIDMANEMSDVRIVLRQLLQNLENKLDSSDYDVDSYNIQALKKELSGLIDQAGGTIDKIDTNMSDAVSKALQDFTSQNFQAEVDSVSQYIFNQKSITHASSTDDLNKLTPWDGRLVYVDNFGLYEYSNANSKWIRHLIPDAGISINYDYSTQQEFNQAQVGWVDTPESLANLTELAHRQVYVSGKGHYQYTTDNGWTETPNADVKFIETVDQLSSLSTWEGRTVNVHNIGNYTFTSGSWVKQTVATNITDASTQDLFNQKGVTTLKSIDELPKIDVWDGRVVYVKSFYEPVYGTASPYIGGAYYRYDSDMTTYSDGLLNRNGWMLQFTDIVNIYQLGLRGDGVTDETKLLNSIVSAIKVYVLNSNINKVILEGSSSYIMLSDNVTFDFCFIGLKNIRFKALDSFKPTSYTSLITYMTSDSWANYPIKARKDFAIIHDNVEILGVDTRDYSAGLFIQPNSVISFAGADFKNLKIINFKYGFVLDENSYLITFTNPQIAGQYCCFTTSFSLGTNSGTQTNMGENIRFIGGTLANSKKVFEMLKGNGMGLHCYGVSFDYCGGTASTGFETWFDFQAGSSEFSFYGCHFESGNENAGLSRMFHLGYRSKISIFGGEMLFSSTTYNNCEYFCYNEDNGQISIEGTKIFAPSVKYWANKGLGKFTPMFNSPNNDETFLTSQYTKSLALDPNMNDSGVSDIFVAGGYTDNVLESSQVKISKGTVSINGVTQNCIQVYKKNGGGSDDSFDIYISRDSRSNCLSSCAIKMYLANGANISNEVSYTLSLIKSRQLNSYGVPIPLSSVDFSSSAWTIDTTTSDKELSVTSLLVGDSYKGYNYYKLHCRLFNFAGQGTLCITGLGFEETD